MKPRVKIINGLRAGQDILHQQDICLQEQFIKQVKDDSLPANRVLTEQKEDRAPDDLSPLFVP